MIEAWLDLPAIALFAVLTVLFACTGTLIAWLAHGTPFGPRVRRLDGVVGPFFGAVGILFALLTGFLAGDIGDRNRQASRAVQAEIAELRNVYTLSVASASDMRAIRAAWTAYVKSVIADDWPALANGDHAAATDAAYENLLRETSIPKIATDSGAAVHAALLTAAVRVGTARSERLAIAADRTNDLKWEIVLILGVMTQVAVGLVHLAKRNPHIAALTVFSISAVATLGLIALQEHPFAGAVQVSSASYVQLLKQHGGNGS
jgi:hypothetical protein